MRLRWASLSVFALALGGWMVTTVLQAQVRSNDAIIAMMDSCEETDAGYNELWRLSRGWAIPRLEFLPGRRDR